MIVFFSQHPFFVNTIYQNQTAKAKHSCFVHILESSLGKYHAKSKSSEFRFRPGPFKIAASGAPLISVCALSTIIRCECTSHKRQRDMYVRTYTYVCIRTYVFRDRQSSTCLLLGYVCVLYRYAVDVQYYCSTVCGVAGGRYVRSIPGFRTVSSSQNCLQR